MPAIRALDGPLVYFVEAGPDLARAFATDFDLADSTAPVGFGLAAVDPVAHVLPDDQLDSWVLFLRTTLGLTPDETMVLPDLYGLIRSRALASANRQVRLPLNISDARNTLTAKSVSAFAGAGVHHIALSTGDIFAAVEAIVQAGGELLAMSANYYDDIRARLDLDGDFVDRMQAANVLYDRDQHGEFLQVYTPPIEDRFFFEIVERRNGYDGYGAANAGARMAALLHWQERRRPRVLPRG